MSNKAKFTLAGLCALLAAILIVLVLFVDVAPIGPEGTEIGLSHLNEAVHNATGVSMRWYELTDQLGLAAILVAGLFALVGAVQLFRRRSLLKVDREILALGVLFLVVIGLYVFFEIDIVNYRPVIMPDETHVEASFPSSHTMLVCATLGGAMLLLGRYIPGKGLRLALQLLCGAAIVVMVVGRLLSGVHWFTDILGGLLISGALLALFSAFLTAEKERAAQ